NRPTLQFLCNRNILRRQSECRNRPPQSLKPMANPPLRRNQKPICKLPPPQPVVPMRVPRAAAEDVEAADGVALDRSARIRPLLRLQPSRLRRNRLPRHPQPPPLSPAKESSCSPSAFPVQARVPGSSATTFVLFQATFCASCFSTTPPSSAFRIWSSPISVPC